MDKVPFAGELDQYISVYRTDYVVNELKERKEVDVLVANARAKMTDTGGSLEEEGKLISVVNRAYIIRRHVTIASEGRKMHLMHNGVKFFIDAVAAIGRTHLKLIVRANE
ncbi:hypothetical protein [Flavobacterium sp. NRK1]|uniref:hypothetical protein n=1 Tax=Flavobacterium sp. NRK1 TaxID=2954929 RepID=UPI0020924703|nr:hypothetical protein [Flavobacterium sp. NRK1]MCO6149061.1 hypothetical protein [Flavobacterium sp. NRK1]